jgi:hypothetical protein
VKSSDAIAGAKGDTSARTTSQEYFRCLRYKYVGWERRIIAVLDASWVGAETLAIGGQLRIIHSNEPGVLTHRWPRKISSIAFHNPDVPLTAIVTDHPPNG